MVTVSFLGDVSLNDKYTQFKKKNINPFLDISPLLQKSDYVVGNLETPSEGNQGENLLKKPRFKTDIDTLGYLETLNMGLVTMANNHVYDNLLDGFNQTTGFLDTHRIDHIGAGLNAAEAAKIFIKNINGLNIAFLNYVHPGTNPNLPANCPVVVNEYTRDKITADIGKAHKKADVVFVLLHWGEDHSYYPAPWQRKDARAFIEAGAHCIIGHHTHTVQGFEKINDSYVFYGIGNFCFSDFWFENRVYELDKRKHIKSVILNIKVTKPITFEAVPIYNNQGIVTIGEKKIHKQFYRISKYIPVVGREPVWTLYSIYLNFIYKIYFFLFGNDRNPVRQIRTINRKKMIRFLAILKGVFKRKR